MAVVISIPAWVEGEDLPLVARPENDSGDVLTRTEITGATLKVYQITGDAPNTVLLTKTLDPNTIDPTGVAGDGTGSTDACMFAALQDDNLWDKTGGYTFWAVVRDSELHLEGGKTYRVELVLTGGHTSPTWPQRTDYGNLVFVWKVSVKPLASL